MNKNEAVQRLSAVGHISRAYASTLYISDPFIYISDKIIETKEVK